jgi:hypothetical protein
VVHAIAEGVKAAEHLDQYLQSQQSQQRY